MRKWLRFFEAALLLLFVAIPLTAAHAQSAAPSIQLVSVVNGLASPLYVTHSKDSTGRLFIVEQAGRIKVLAPGAAAPVLFLDIAAKIVAGGEQGLLGLAFHPRFASNSRFFVNYTRASDGATVIAEYRAGSTPALTSASETILLSYAQPFANHNGGMLEFGPDGFLYIGSGDGGSANDPGNRAQNPNELLGKILRIDVDHSSPPLPYSSPSGNPYAGAIPGRDEIFAIGMRNPWRFSFDRGTGQLYVGDVGQGALEEVDIVSAGGNYGWRVYEGTHCTNIDPAACVPGNYVAPIAQYDHSGGRCSITGGYVYRGSRGTLPLGAYVFGDYCTGEIFMFKDGVLTLLLDTSLNISSFGEDEAGEIYVVGLGGTIQRIARTTTPDTVWIEDALPPGAVPEVLNDGWMWVGSNPPPFSGSLSHQSTIAAGLHQHYFYNGSPLMLSAGDSLFTYVYLDPANPPSEIMLQWHDGSWEHRVYWGANQIAWGADGTMSRRFMGPLPSVGGWVRLEIPVEAVGLDGRTIDGMAFTLFNGRAAWDRSGRSGGGVWVDDAPPPGAVLESTSESWNWISSNPAPFSGSLAHQSAAAAGLHQHYFYNASPLNVGAGDSLFTYVYLDPTNTPSEVMLQWNDGSWEHRAYWGANQIAWGTDGTASRRYMGPLPPAGRWVRIDAPAAAVGLAGRPVSGMAFTLFNGLATWDRADKSAETVWVEDSLPAGALPDGLNEGWSWVTANPAPFSGSLSHPSAAFTGLHQHYFSNGAPLTINVGDKLFSYIYLDPANPPTEVMMQWNDGSWEHRAYWGANQIAWGADGTVSRRFKGSLPAAGTWVLLEIAASDVGLEGRTINGMAFTLFNGRASWDRAGKR